MQKSKLPIGLYGITPEWDDTKQLIKAVISAAKGGMKILQLRRKKTTYEKIKLQTSELCKVCQDVNVKFIINDFWELAVEYQADGFHLGIDDFDLNNIKNKIDTGLIVGVSCYNDINRAKMLVQAGVDYVAFGAVFKSNTKPLARHISLNEIKEARNKINNNKPYSIVAIGGININNAKTVIESNVDNIAVLNGLFDSDNIFETAQALSSQFTKRD
ncbi:thiamine phosphate synthase [Candidatus Kinetoplastidibacterium crithidiae]|uniref:Thiamine-phosphate synthase n=1 Tax=Candidatus Kinetoplastidibacterium crithidiae TCC036E TaxID=1208918 RepID=M1LUY2_9PROT|nr:thiamine phosphate synthase [Candidatus Kinetoplastibacterium crithidii]AFZ82905.1 thiamine-phosphate pyrophosphorylase [Candidatus Kinetoplastibacterium crithidii (ex Angomonas deanei ATCC 30255)]AGF47906.1 thiamine-phosphate pyrophosphorylase [Candidatus Kinetoplastibacterium crithidii TCC036E]